MDRIVIQGGARLEGRIDISGAKNSALKLMAAALLTDEPVILTRMPRLADSRFLGHLLAKLGVEVSERDDAQLSLHAATITDTFAPYDLVRKMRASFNVLGPLLAREGHARVSLPGGCAIGARPVDLHLKALKALGAEIEIAEGYVSAKAPKGGLVGAEIDLPFASVGATEHAMLAAALARGETVIENAAREPEIGDLADCLTAMGATIEGAGSSTIRIQGRSRLSGVTHKVVADRIETATYALAVAAAGGDAVLDGAVLAHNKALWSSMHEAGVTVEAVEGGVRIARNGSRLNSVDIETQPFPGFPTDAQAQFMALMSMAAGSSVIRETIFENRFMHAPELARLGADITVHGNEAVVRGVERLRGAPVMATDLRASVSLVIAGLAAEGETVVNRVYHLDRGFERLEAKLSGCGAKIERLPGSA
ncbi:UDP-N-acetylglucosamine 1-carboxyvinyltransferase [Maricaulis sp. W15]|uniref:UDP-N-acetylglucosamine 1-carboxyvinyltransferase n=1 Tax=Maricaulis sp. W15 TaxID=1772333 RepID=UPI000948AAF5|nr:UDP-N-acetylglucosamine 1-carboxyvinyltransferase [Maricaulis sp. W15]OLF77702.1 UDP-N-acetylglucosamine 1-carboxyvinyltransferase [Maricaulis sp. W15]